MGNQSYWIYILYCNNNTYYTGYTNDLVKRFEAHVNGTASKYTRSFKPVRMAQCWKINGDKSLAMKIERYIKKLSRIDKERIINEPLLLSTDQRVEFASTEISPFSEVIVGITITTR